MIITLTLNPTVDKALTLQRLMVGEVNRAVGTRSDPGGKGVNVSRVLRELGHSSVTMGFVSGPTGRFVEAALNEKGIVDDFVHTPGQTRTNIKIHELETSITTDINESGPSISAHYLEELRERLDKRLTSDDWLVLAGSIPPGIPNSIYAEFVELAHSKGARVALDTDGEQLALGVAKKPTFIKPNQRELEHLCGRSFAGVEDAIAAARELQAGGVTYVAVSFGAGGALGVGPGETWRIHPPKVTMASGVGAGDSFVAGVVLSLSLGKSFAEGLQLGAAAGAATAMTPGTELCSRQDVEALYSRVQVLPA